ncbi:F-box protein At1g80960-like [Arachis ipaensis]|nr:F-box protein At1g80960-like [Arachis ipaensis]XP_025637592.1 F-box protein At1g80960-like [Arachis hypogaea]QHO00267.1 Putative F-box protein [Arachis hypogaea]
MRKEENETAHDAPSDRLSYLPNEPLTMVSSSLVVAEAVRTSTLAKSWQGLWRHAERLEFDETTMPGPFILPERQHGTGSLCGTVIGVVFNGYVGDLTSISFKQFPRSIDVGELEFWVDFVLNKFKKINSLSLECECLVVEPKPPFFPKGSRTVKLNFRPMIFSNLNSLELTNYTMTMSTPEAFNGCGGKLKILKLKNMRMSDDVINGVLRKCLGLESLSIVESKGFKTLEINNPWLKFLELGWLIVNEVDVSIEGLETLVVDSLMCPPKGLKIYTVNLRILHVSCNSIAQRIRIRSHDQPLLKMQDIFEYCSNLLGYNSFNIFQNILITSIDLDLNNIRESMAFSYILRLFPCLETLEITIPPVEEEECSAGANNSYDNVCLPFPTSMFSERNNLYNCIYHTLKFATIKGFTGKEQEVKFIEHIIKKATIIKKITIISDSATIVKEAKALFRLPRNSIYLSIVFKSESNDVAQLTSQVQNKMSFL